MTAESKEQVAGQVLMAGFDGEAAPPLILRALETDSLAGTILFRRNLVEIQQITALTTSLSRASAVLAPLVGIDQEGGRVQRLQPPVTQLPPMRTLGDLDDARLTKEIGRHLGHQLDALGFNLNFAPVLDVHTNPENQVIGDRAFSDHVLTVTKHAKAFAQGLARAGLMACGKHFPGHGDTLEDSHYELPILDHDMERMEAVELYPFRQLASSLGSIMTAHVVFRTLDPDLPATLSRRVVHELLRNDVGFDGIVISDDLDMKAISNRWPAGQAAVQAINAGCDLLLVCQNTEHVFEAREALAKEATDNPDFAERLQEAAFRVRGARSALQCNPMTDPAALDIVLNSTQSKDLTARLFGN